MRTYTFKLVIREGNDEWWESLLSTDNPCFDDVEEAVRNALYASGFNLEEKDLFLLEYKDVRE